MKPAEFPIALIDAEHQQAIYDAMLVGYRMPAKLREGRPKIAYRSDSTQTLFLCYVLGGHYWVAAINVSKEMTVNAQDYWELPVDVSDDAMKVTMQFFTDVSYFINKWQVPEGRNQKLEGAG